MLHKDIFQKNTELITVRIDSNQQPTVDVELFSRNLKLQNVYLRYNVINNIDLHIDTFAKNSNFKICKFS